MERLGLANSPCSRMAAPWAPRPFRRRDGSICLPLHAADFPPADEHWLGLQFAPIDTSCWSAPEGRSLGAGVFAISLEPRRGQWLRKFRKAA